MSEPYNGWSVLELLGHRRLHGLVQETTLAGAGFLRIDVYEGPAEAASATQFYPPGSVYCLTPTTEEACRKASMPWTPPALAQPEDPDNCCRWRPVLSDREALQNAAWAIVESIRQVRDLLIIATEAKGCLCCPGGDCQNFNQKRKD